MSTMELRTSLLQEVAVIIADDDLTAEALKALKALRRKAHTTGKLKEVESPCNYIVDDIKKRASHALARYEQGDYASQEEMLQRTKQWDG